MYLLSNCFINWLLSYPRIIRSKNLCNEKGYDKKVVCTNFFSQLSRHLTFTLVVYHPHNALIRCYKMSPSLFCSIYWIHSKIIAQRTIGLPSYQHENKKKLIISKVMQNLNIAFTVFDSINSTSCIEFYIHSVLSKKYL